jgi:PAS domain S-box-containing protein
LNLKVVTLNSVSSVCEQEKVEAVIRERNDRYRDLVEHSHDLLCTHTLDGRLLSVNPAPARILGYEVDELLAIPMRNLLAPEYRGQLEQYLERIKQRGEDRGLMVLVTRSGEQRIWEYQNTLRTDGVVEPIVRGLAHDITERKRLEDAIKTLVRKVRSDSSEHFFPSMAHELARCLQAEFTMIGELISENGTEEAVRTLAVCARGKAEKNFVYHLAGTPCEQVITRRLCSYRCGVAKAFPKDAILRRIAVEGYVGTALFDSEERPIGIMVALYSRPLKDTQFAESIIQLFSTRTAAEIERNRTQAQLRELSERLQSLQDEERRRVARELHDSTAQKLAALKMGLGSAKRPILRVAPKLAESLNECLTLAEECIQELRTFAQLLHPPVLDEFGLYTALRAYIGSLRRRSELNLTLRVDAALERAALPKATELALFRIVQEALTNMRLHSRSKSGRIHVHLAPKCNEVVLTIADTGRGLPRKVINAIRTGAVSSCGVGIAGMLERAKQLGGQFEVTSSKRGTQISVMLPLTPNQPLPHPVAKSLSNNAQ